MIQINVTSKAMQNGDNVTSYTNTVGTAQETFTFLTTQETVILRNKGTKNINYMIGSNTGVLTPSTSVKVSGSFDSLVLSSEQGTQAFEVWADEAGVRSDAPVLDGLLTSLAEKMTYFSNSKNVFNKSEQVSPNITDNSYLNASGVVSGLGSYFISSFIPVKALRKYILTNKGGSQSFFGGWYDSTKTWVSNISMTSGISTVAPANSEYIRLNIDKTVDIDTIYFHEINDYYQDFYRGKKVNFLGDSITYGFGTSKSYISYLNDVIGFSVVRNYGLSSSNIATVSGDPVLSFETRYKTMDNDADIVFIYGGVNDFLHTTTAPIGTSADRTTGTFYGSLHVLLSGIVKKYLDKKLFFMTPLHTQTEDTPNPTTSKTLVQYVDIIKEVCKYYGIKVIDLYSECLFQPNNTYINNLLGYDAIHPNERGHKNIADVILREL